MAESKEELKSLLIRVTESEKAGLKLNIQKNNIMAFGLITSWQTDGKSGKSSRFYFLGLQNHCGDSSHKINKHLLLRRKTMTNLDSMLESRDITLLTKVHLVKTMFFSSSHVWM